MIILDTNVLSELMKPNCFPAVTRWVSKQLDDELYISSITVAELYFGIGLLPVGKKQAELERSTSIILEQHFADCILPFDAESGEAYGKLASLKKKSGFQPAHFDLQIAAIASVSGATVATRNIRDFEECGVKLINPWDQV